MYLSKSTDEKVISAYNGYFAKIRIKLLRILRPPYCLRKVVELSAQSKNISVEMALNSRCNSDYDGIPEIFHWGAFDKKKKLTKEQIETIVGYAKIPEFTNHRSEINSDYNILTFIIENQTFEIERQWLMVESGMQQQAVCLVCSALGVGLVFKNRGKNGALISDEDYATISMRLDPIKPAYGNSYWSTEPPSDPKPWKKGNLQDPKRDGPKPLLDILLESTVFSS